MNSGYVQHARLSCGGNTGVMLVLAGTFGRCQGPTGCNDSGDTHFFRDILYHRRDPVLGKKIKCRYNPCIAREKNRA
jgi:hypothetical protein